MQLQQLQAAQQLQQYPAARGQYLLQDANVQSVKTQFFIVILFISFRLNPYDVSKSVPSIVFIWQSKATLLALMFMQVIFALFVMLPLSE